ncbi:MAG: RluA family pseudouridine synthase [Spirochaetes bacterium]|nr:RluA family pseudouridine synthase [Spirochaetota bacterium]MBN2771875.1 RluA family pseudouridine synthase [Spirochaetota bacterium]
MRIEDHIIHEDNHLFVINKPEGMLAQGDSSERQSLNEIIKEYIKARDKKPGNVFLGIVQRLDRQVSGAIVYAKTSKAASRLSKQIRDHEICKYYICITSSKLATDTPGKWVKVEKNFIRRGNKTFKADLSDKEAKIGKLYYTTVTHNSRYSLHIVRLITGRKHQIRATFNILDNPIADDALYGGSKKQNNSILLHSFYLKFRHPVNGTELTFVTDIPDRFINYTDFNINRSDLCALIIKTIDNFKI